MLIYVLIILFILLITYQLFISFNTNTLIEGLENTNTNTNTNTQEYKPYNLADPNNSLILPQQNAGNIEVLKGRVDTLDGIKNREIDLDIITELFMNFAKTKVNGKIKSEMFSNNITE
jgi:hypothetical protein